MTPKTPFASDLPRPTARGGFSLVEVVLALGVVTFALVAILGLLSTLLNTSRDSGWSSDSGMIFKQIVNQLRAKPFTGTQTGEGADYPLPALNVAGNKSEFYINERSEFAGLASEALPTNAEYAVVIWALNAPALKIAGIPEPPPAANGGLAFVRIEITPAVLFHAGRTDATIVFITEIAALEH